MNQNSSVDNDLQKAIDDITKTTEGDPIFADPVAAPVQEVATASVAETIAPVAPAPEVVAPMPAPEMVTTPVSAPVPGQRSVDPMVNPISGPIPTPTFVAPAPMPVAPAPVAPVAEAIAPAPEVAAAPAAPVASAAEIVPAGSNQIDEDIVTVAPFVDDSASDLSIKQVKEAALRGLAPILSKMDVPAEQKFDIYKNVIDNYHDSSVIGPAYHAASEIADDRERGEALLYLVDSIDNM